MDLVIVFFATKLYIVIVVAAVLVFLYSSRQLQRSLFLKALITMPLAFVISRVAKLFVDSPRPFVDGHMVNIIAHTPDNGFPSDHALLVFTVAAIVYTQNKVVGSVLIGLGVLVGVGRIAAGVHHTIDVLGGVLIAFVATYIAVLILRRWQI